MDENDQEEPKVEALSQPAPGPDPRERLESLFRRYHRQVFHAAHRVTGNAMDAEDALQTVFMRLLRRTEGPVLADDLGGYLHRAAVNAALDIVRSKRAAATTSLDDGEIALVDDASADSERQVADREMKDRIRAAVARLSPNAAEVFALRYFEGYGNHEIARMLGTSRSTVGVMLHRARHRVKAEIRDMQESNHEQD